MSPAALYTLLRLGLFVVCLLGFALLGAEPVLAVILAALVSMALSYVLLRKQRDAVAAQLAERLERRLASRGSAGASGDEAVEDAAVDSAEDRSAGGKPPN